MGMTKLTPSNCSFQHCHYNTIPPGEQAQECIGCDGNKKGPKTKVVQFGELGGNCWLPHRFLGGRCNRVWRCKYPEKKTCLAVDAEIKRLQAYKEKDIARLDKLIAELMSGKEK
jgi:hypothetical protein